MRNTTPVYHLLPVELCSLTLCTDTGILGEIATGIEFPFLKPGHWVNLCVHGCHHDKKTGGDIHQHLNSRRRCCDERIAILKTILQYKVGRAGQAPFIFCHVQSLTKKDTAMKSEWTVAICIPVEVGGGVVEAPVVRNKPPAIVEVMLIKQA